MGQEWGLLWLKGEGASSVCTCPKAAAKKQSEKPKSRDPDVCSHTPGRLAKLRPARERGGDVGSRPTPKARPTLLISVCEADGRGRGSAGAQGEDEGSRPPEEVAYALLHVGKLSRNERRDVCV